ncbi:MAG: CHAT domain-containing protein [Leptolyngbyaceae cyanobacterium SU_3_3]|nr:CHAT domain-containing protein [Leptolyngbyaceae cyanobacterium SU_3_3]
MLLAIYAQIELAECLVKLIRTDRASHLVERSSIPSLLATAIQQARKLGNLRAESYALGRLGQVYEQNQQWSDAQFLTQQALTLSEMIHASDITYQWQWQAGRIIKAKADLQNKNQADKNAEYEKAITSYTNAISTLQSLRSDLIVISQDAESSFREQVEPVYREFIDLLLTQANASPGLQIEQQNLKRAQETIESLQLAEIANFFREACLDWQPRSIEQIDPAAAMLYPIVLPDRLEVILAIAGQPLRHYATYSPQADIEAATRRMRQSLRSTSFAQERLPIAQEIYTWLIKPALPDLSRHLVKTLVFVLDDTLRDLPMSALYDGRQYLIEQYQIAVTPGLRLFQTRSTHPNLSALVGGFSRGNSEFPALPGVSEEVEKISQTVSSTVLLDETFTTQSLKDKAKRLPFSVMHLATHGQFSSKIEDTYVATWDGRINVKALNALLTDRELPDLPAIELLVLSACETAKGDRRAALGLAGMAVRSGAQSTLATLWRVNDQSTTAFMVQFYQAWTSGLTKADAVRSAQLYLLNQRLFNHPYFWAPFELVGGWL